MIIPEQVKIKGTYYRVRGQGKGYISIGEVSVEMDLDEKERIRNLPYEQHFKPWEAEETRVFELALKEARKRT